MKELLIVNALQDKYTKGHDDVVQSIKRTIAHHLENRIGPILYSTMLTTDPRMSDIYPQVGSEDFKYSVHTDNGKMIYVKDRDVFPYWFPTLEDYYGDTITKVHFVGTSLNWMLQNAIIIASFYPDMTITFDLENTIEKDDKVNHAAVNFLRDCGFLLR